MTLYIDQAHDCLDEHITRYRRLSPEERKAAREWTPPVEPEQPKLDVELRKKIEAAQEKLLEAVKAKQWREVIRHATVLVAHDAQLGLIEWVCEQAPEEAN